MRGVQLPFSNTQKLRYERALAQLESLSSKVNTNAIVIVADTIPVDEDGALKGHGTLDMGKNVVATVCGVVERVNKLVYVRSLRARYKPEIGDIIVGRVIEVAPKRWRLEINFSQDAVLMLSSMNLPDGIQRRRTAIDELNMRTIFVENDVICAEVRGFQHDGSLHLQARSQKYGKLERGRLLTIPPYLVKRRKQHFHHLDQYGVDLILGCNGFIWIGEHVEVKDAMVEDQVNKSDPQNTHAGSLLGSSEEPTFIPPETREYICRITNAITVFAALDFMVTLEGVIEMVNLSLSLNLDVDEMLKVEFHVQVAEKEAERRSMLTKRR